MLIDAGLTDRYWGEAVMATTYIQNLLPTRVRQKTPFELFFKRKPESPESVWVSQHLRRKLDNKTRECILVRYSQKSKAYRLLEKNTRTIITSRDVKFVEIYENKLNFGEKRVSFALNERERESADGEPTDDREREQTVDRERKQVGGRDMTHIYVVAGEINNQVNQQNQGEYGQVQDIPDSSRKTPHIIKQEGTPITPRGVHI